MFEQKKIWAFFLTLAYFITYVLNILATIEVNRESATMLDIILSFLVLIGGSTIVLIRFGKWWCGLFLIFFKALIDNQLLHTVLKGFISIFVEMHLDGVSCIPQFPLEAGCLLLVFVFCYILLLYKKREHID